MAVTSSVLADARRLVTLVGDSADDATRALTALWLAEWAGLVPLWTRAADDLAELRRDGRATSTRAALGVTSVRVAIAMTQLAVDNLLRQAEAINMRSVRTAVGLTTSMYPGLIVGQLPPGEQPVAVFRVVTRYPSAAMLQMIERVQQTIHSLHQPLSDGSVAAIKAELVRGIGDGDNGEDIARTAARMQAAYDLSLSRAINISRTEILDAYRNAAHLFDQANSDVLAGWVWTSALDRRTCPACWSKHGTVYPTSTPGPWDHQQGRCARVPVVRPWRELGIDLDEPASVGRDARAVFAGLSERDQLKIMGPARLDALRSGAADWSDLSIRRSNDAWRDSFAARSVSDLMNLKQET